MIAAEEWVCSVSTASLVALVRKAYLPSLLAQQPCWERLLYLPRRSWFPPLLPFLLFPCVSLRNRRSTSRCRARGKRRRTTWTSPSAPASATGGSGSGSGSVRSSSKASVISRSRRENDALAYACAWWCCACTSCLCSFFVCRSRALSSSDLGRTTIRGLGYRAL